MVWVDGLTCTCVHVAKLQWQHNQRSLELSAKKRKLLITPSQPDSISSSRILLQSHLRSFNPGAHNDCQNPVCPKHGHHKWLTDPAQEQVSSPTRLTVPQDHVPVLNTDTILKGQLHTESDNTEGASTSPDIRPAWDEIAVLPHLPVTDKAWH